MLQISFQTIPASYFLQFLVVIIIIIILLQVLTCFLQVFMCVCVFVFFFFLHHYYSYTNITIIDYLYYNHYYLERSSDSQLVIAILR